MVNPTNGKVELAKAFDTYKSSDELDGFILSGCSKGYILAAACKDDCFTSLSYEGSKFFGEMGSKFMWKLGYRKGFAFIGISGKIENAVVNEKRSYNTKDAVSVT